MCKNEGVPVFIPGKLIIPFFSTQPLILSLKKYPLLLFCFTMEIRHISVAPFYSYWFEMSEILGGWRHWNFLHLAIRSDSDKDLAPTEKILLELLGEYNGMWTKPRERNAGIVKGGKMTVLVKGKVWERNSNYSNVQEYKYNNNLEEGTDEILSKDQLSPEK